MAKASLAYYKEQQLEEATVLTSVFDEKQILSLKTENCWKKWSPLEAIIRLLPRQEPIHVSVDVEFRCSDRYPDQPCAISIKGSRHIDDASQAALISLLKSKAHNLTGNVMIYELCTTAEEFLECHNQVPETEYDVMVKTKFALEAAEKRKRTVSERRACEEIDEAHEHRRVEKANRQEELVKLRSSVLVDGIRLVLLQGEEVVLKKIDSPSQMRASFHQFCTESLVEHKGKLVLMSEWSFAHAGRIRDTSELTDFHTDLNEFYRQAVKLLKTLDFDCFIATYLFVNLNKVCTNASNFKVVLSYGQYINASDKNLKTILDGKSMKNELPLLASTVVGALKWLHENSLWHGHIDATSVWMDKRQNFYLSDAIFLPEILNFCQRFADLVNTTTAKNPAASVKAMVPPGSPISSSTGLLRQMTGVKSATKHTSRRQDIAALGSLLESVAPKSSDGSAFVKDLQNLIKACNSFIPVDDLVLHPFLTNYSTTLLNTSSSTINSSSIGVDAFEHTRLHSDFYAYRFLGKGGFGQVILARNKLDGNDYAIKLIPINANNRRVVRKLTREANLLARLNHEHVVRYFNAWTETASEEPVDHSESDTRSEDTISSSNDRFAAHNAGDFTVLRSDAHQDSAHQDSHRSRTDDEDGSSSTSDDSESSSSSGDKGLFRKPRTTSADEYSTIFIDSEASNNDRERADYRLHLSKRSVTYHHQMLSPHYPHPNISDDNSEFTRIEFYNEDVMNDDHIDEEDPEDDEKRQSCLPKILYIQMEFCDQKTLRVWIDEKNLLRDIKLTWRLVREILLGLEYIHDQNMIHRDIKPGNIFLDGHASVKIGDFGLATLESVFKQPDAGDSAELSNTPVITSSQTKGIGTGFYIAPEIDVHGGMYDNKCDVYSVGVVLFEMFYRPLPNGMERNSLLSHLRDFLGFPDDFAFHVAADSERANIRKLIKWMMALDPNNRPTVAQLLHDNLVPFVESEESSFAKQYGQSLRNPRSRIHRYALEQLFAVDTPPAVNYMYDLAICVGNQQLRSQIGLSAIEQELGAIFSLYGISKFQMHPLTPVDGGRRHYFTKSTLHQPCMLLDPSGVVVTLESDMRINFVRYCVRNCIRSIRRFGIGPIFVASEYPEAHPVYRNECIVDLIAPSPSMSSDSASRLTAEMLAIAIDIGRKLPCIADLRKTLRVGHAAFVEVACAIHSVVDYRVVRTVYDYLHSCVVATTATKSKPMSTASAEQLASHAGIAVETAKGILRFLQGPEASQYDFTQRMKKAVKGKSGEIRNRISAALADIVGSLKFASQLTSIRNLTVLFDPSLAYRPFVFSHGIVFLLQVDVPYKNTTKPRVILAGGRYDTFFASQRHPKDGYAGSVFAIGLNVQLDPLHAINMHCTGSGATFSPCRVIVFANTSTHPAEVSSLVSQLRSHGLPTIPLFDDDVSTLEDVLAYAQEQGIPFVLDGAKLQLYDNVDVTKSGKRPVLLSFALHASKSYEDAIRLILHFHSAFVSSKMLSTNENAAAASNVALGSGTGLPGIMAASVSTSASASSTTASAGVTVGSANMTNVSIVCVERHYSLPAKKKIEQQVAVSLASVLPNFSSKVKIVAFAVALPAAVLGQLLSVITRQSTVNEIESAFQSFISNRQPVFETLLDLMRPLFDTITATELSPIVLVSTVDGSYRFII